MKGGASLKQQFKDTILSNFLVFIKEAING